MADKQSGAKAEASSRGLSQQVLSPEEPLCLLFLFPRPTAAEDSQPLHFTVQNRCHKLKITRRTRGLVPREPRQGKDFTKVHFQVGFPLSDGTNTLIN